MVLCPSPDGEHLARDVHGRRDEQGGAQAGSSGTGVLGSGRACMPRGAAWPDLDERQARRDSHTLLSTCGNALQGSITEGHPQNTSKVGCGLCSRAAAVGSGQAPPGHLEAPLPVDRTSLAGTSSAGSFAAVTVPACASAVAACCAGAAGSAKPKRNIVGGASVQVLIRCGDQCRFTTCCGGSAAGSSGRQRAAAGFLDCASLRSWHILCIPDLACLCFQACTMLAARSKALSTSQALQALQAPPRCCMLRCCVAMPLS